MFDFKNLFEAKSVDDAITLLTNNPDARIIAGGSDVLINIRNGKLKNAELVSIFTLDELRTISIDAQGTLRIGTLASFTDIAENEDIRRCVHTLSEAADKVGGPQIRNIGTIGGNICNGVTSADTATTLLAYDAQVEVKGPEGYRIIKMTDFYNTAHHVNIAHNEIATGILINKKHYSGFFGHYIKYAMRNAMDIATIGCSVNVNLSADHTLFEDVRIAFGVTNPVPVRAFSAENAARGKKVSQALLDEIAQVSLNDINPRTSWRASKEFRTHLSKELVKECFVEAISRAGGSIS